MQKAEPECFIETFLTAESHGKVAVRKAFGAAFTKWKTNTTLLTELVATIEMRREYWAGENAERSSLAELYDSLYERANNYAVKHLRGGDLAYYFDYEGNEGEGRNEV